ncbi:MAG: YtxH domain-containing protein [Fluviicola sp.]|nr:YtxH domain-containing protein [Fluviicola sp.]
MEDSNNTGKIIGALLVGVAIGGLLGVLFAPDKGSVTRKKLLSKGEDLKDVVTEKLSGLMARPQTEKEEEEHEATEGKHA